MAHTINDYLELITSQYQNSPKYKKWVERLLTPYIDTQKLASTLYTYFDIDKAVGKQLDMLGEVIGVKRLLPFQPEGSGTGTPNPIFNKSAFTVVGNPTITDDGIASGFSSGNYINWTTGYTDTNYSTLEINFPSFITSDITGEQYIMTSVLGWYFIFGINNGGWIEIVARNSSETSLTFTDTKNNKLISANTRYYAKLVFNGSRYDLLIKGGIWTDWTSLRYAETTEKILLGANVRFTGRYDYPNTYFKGSIDLKQFSITVDGKEVFSGSQLNPLLDDENYRFLLKAQILRNVWNGTNQHIYEIWNELHSDIAIAIEDNQDMTVTALFIGDLNKLQQEMIKYGMIVPKAQGVKMFYAFSLPPLFSYDQDTEYFKGYDEGNWAESII